MCVADILAFQHLLDHLSLLKHLPDQQGAESQKKQADNNQKDAQRGSPPSMTGQSVPQSTGQTIGRPDAGSRVHGKVAPQNKPVTIHSYIRLNKDRP
jgi:hypothetical protein